MFEVDTIFHDYIHNMTSNFFLYYAQYIQVLLVGLNESALVPYIVTQLKDAELAIQIASRLQLPGAEDLYQVQFNQLLQQGDVQGAAKVAAESPRGLLRTPQTIQMFQSVPPQPGQPQPVFQYFSVLLEKGKLNHMETIELAKPVLQQGEQLRLQVLSWNTTLTPSAQDNLTLFIYDVCYCLSLLSII